MTSLLKELIFLILVSRIIPVVLGTSSESGESEERANGQGSKIRKYSRKFFLIRGDELVFKPQRRNGCADFLEQVQKKIGQGTTIQLRGRTYHLSNVNCNQQRCENEPRQELCGSNKEDKTNLRLFKNACHQCAEGCKQVKNGSDPFEKVNNAVIVNGNCYTHTPVSRRLISSPKNCNTSRLGQCLPSLFALSLENSGFTTVHRGRLDKTFKAFHVLVRKELDTVFCSRPHYDHSCSIGCSDLRLPPSGLPDLPHLPNFRSTCAESHNR